MRRKRTTAKAQDQRDPESPSSEQGDAATQAESIIEPENPLPEVNLAQLPDRAQAAFARAGWGELLPVQAKAIPYMLAGREVLVQARTGSGKTGAFLLPIIEQLNPDEAACQALILAPTRELAVQVSHEAEMMSGAEVRVIAVYGGVGYGPQLDAFRKGAHIVVGTPGRILDHLLKGSLSLKKLRYLVFDEADRLLSMGFYPDMKQIQKHLPRRGLRVNMFSATFPDHVLRLAREFMTKPEFLSLSKDHIHVTSTEHIYYYMPAMEKDRCLVRIIELENPSSAIIFCNTKEAVRYVAMVLQRFGYDADDLTADLSQAAREKVLDRVRRGELRFLVATDLAARGIDISELSHVIQYEPPQDHELYIHRAGRTGRVGAAGVAISLVTGLEEIELKRIAKQYEIGLIQRPLPTPQDVSTVVAERLTVLLEARLRDRDKLENERMLRFAGMARDLAASEDSLSLITMLIDDYYQKQLHAPPPQPPQSEPAPQKRRRDSSSTPKSGRRRGGHGRKPRR